MSNDSYPLYLAEQSRQLDQLLIDDGTSGYELMCLAGTAVFNWLLKRYVDARKILVLCGGGNNGGDGYVIATLAADSDFDVSVMAISQPASEDAKKARDGWLNSGQIIEPVDTDNFAEFDLIVDAIFGTGLSRAPSSEYANIISAVNDSRVHVLAVDMPSGLNSDSGHAPGACIHADLTVTFIGRKLGLFTGRGPDYSGRVVFEPLITTQRASAIVPSVAASIATPLLRKSMPCLHKGEAGHLLVAGGDFGMAGSVILAGETALRSGAGLVSILSHVEHMSAVVSRRPELMTVDANDQYQIESRLERCDAIVLGPGLGQGDWGESLFNLLIETGKPMLLDADALNLLAKRELTRENWVFTPHPGEAARLLGCSTAEIESDRPAAVREIADRYGCCCVLKGCGSLIACSDKHLWLCDRGNPGMATAGMGDALSGIIGALLASGYGLDEAAKIGVWLHGNAADTAARIYGQHGLIAGDIAAVIGKCMAACWND